MKVDIRPDIAQAIENGRPVVALESTILAHGMPYPTNLKMAQEVADIISGEGALSATAAVIDGLPTLGLTADQKEKLAQGKQVLKLSRRDMPYAVSKRLTGATTVAGTMMIAASAGVEIFVTGGIGGVHRGVEQTWDVSADLIELAQTNVSVVSAGAKSILDIPKTLEYLETFGVPVVGFGTSEFPAFYYRDSGCKLSQRLDSPEQIAALIRAKREMNLDGAVLVANPVPSDQQADKNQIEAAIRQAISKAESMGVIGKNLTPFLLSEISEITAGTSLDANLALVKNNAQVGARIAVELAKFRTLRS